MVFNQTTTRSFHVESYTKIRIPVDRLNNLCQQPVLFRRSTSYKHWRINHGGAGADQATDNLQRVVDMDRRKNDDITVIVPTGHRKKFLHYDLHISLSCTLFVLADVTEDGYGQKKIVCPITYKAVAMALRAVTYLHLRQQGRQVMGSKKRNPSPLITGSTAIKSLFETYKRGLVYGEFGIQRNPTADCILRNSYKLDQHLRLLADTWQAIRNPALLLAMREHFSIAVRHAMLLCDEDLCNLN